MVIVMESTASEKQIKHMTDHLQENHFSVHRSDGLSHTVLGAIGEKRGFDHKLLQAMSGVKKVIHVTEPYKLAGRVFHPQNTIIKIKDVQIGANEVVSIAGPCSVESKEQIQIIAASVKKSGAKILRGGAFKPRTSPYAFQGLGEIGLSFLREAADNNGLLTISEVMGVDKIDMVAEYSDILQVGARNMQNYDLLRQLGKIRKPVMIKRGPSATFEELLLAAEYIMAGGNFEVILCERGIRTFEKATRNTLDLSAVPVLQNLSHLPVIVDPSHGTGIRDMVMPMARAAIASGANGIMVEVHHAPENALSDGQQSLLPEQFERLMQQCSVISSAIGKQMSCCSAELKYAVAT